MDFCTQCGNSVKAEERFCGKCGSELKKTQLSRESSPVATAENINSVQANYSKPPRKIQKYNMKLIIAAIVVTLIIGYYVMSPKQLTEREYEDLVIELLVKNAAVMEEFSEEIEYSGIYMGYEPEWSEEYKQLIKPAKALEKDFGDLRKILEDVKPPKYFEYEHETLLKAFNAHQNMASNMVSYMTNGNEKYMDLSDEYYDRAEDYWDESIFFSDEYEDRIMQAYEQSGLY